MRWFFSEVRASLRMPVTLAGWVFLTLLMALGGPFGSHDQAPLQVRLLIWLAVTALAIVAAVMVRVVVYSRFADAGLWPAGLITSGVVALVLAWPLHLLFAAGQRFAGLVAPGPGELALFVFVLTLGFCALRHAVESVPAPLPTGTPSTGGGLPRLADRLPPDLRGPVRRVSGRDHYVDIVTEQGSAAVLMRFSDALAELSGADGVQVHRSHWVGAHAVREAVRDGNRLFLRLDCGTQVPVSRTWMPEVERRGWLDQA